MRCEGQVEFSIGTGERQPGASDAGHRPLSSQHHGALPRRLDLGYSTLLLAIAVNPVVQRTRASVFGFCRHRSVSDVSDFQFCLVLQPYLVRIAQQIPSENRATAEHLASIAHVPWLSERCWLRFRQPEVVVLGSWLLTPLSRADQAQTEGRDPLNAKYRNTPVGAALGHHQTPPTSTQSNHALASVADHTQDKPLLLNDTAKGHHVVLKSASA
jgi:hypothetical protein